MYRPILAATFILIAGPASADEPAKNAKQAKEELAAIQGKWRPNETASLFFWTAWVSKERFPNFEEFSSSKSIEIKGDKLRYGKKLGHEITIVLGTADGKKTISFKHGDNAAIVGIYELDKGVLQICAIDPKLGGGKDEVRLPKECTRTRAGWFAKFEIAKP